MKQMTENKDKLTSLERYKTLIAARNFHYDNYNKWMTYFYVAIGALFVGYYTIISSDLNKIFENEILLLISLGYIVSILWFLSSKGYYFWNINFITLVNDCELNDLQLKPNERVYYTFANKKTQNNYFNPISGANISTSKVAILFAYIIAVIWGYLLLNKTLNCNIFILFFLSAIITSLVSALMGYFLKSKITHFPDLKIKQKDIK